MWKVAKGSGKMQDINCPLDLLCNVRKKAVSAWGKRRVLDGSELNEERKENHRVAYFFKQLS